MAQLLGTLEQKEDDILERICEFNAAHDKIKAAWAAELQRKFLPKYVANWSSGIVHMVKDESQALCGYSYRCKPQATLIRSMPHDMKPCHAPGCAQGYAAGES